MSNYTRGAKLTDKQVKLLEDTDIILLQWTYEHHVVGSVSDLKSLGYTIGDVYNVTVWPANLDAEFEARRKRRGTL